MLIVKAVQIMSECVVTVEHHLVRGDCVFPTKTYPYVLTQRRFDVSGSLNPDDMPTMLGGWARDLAEPICAIGGFHELL